MPGALHLGVDFGTSHTVAMLRDNDTATPLLFDGTPLLPSAVYADPDGTLRTGRDAVHSARIDPARFEPNPKRRVDDGAILLGDNELEVTEVFAAVLDRVRQECVRVTGSLPATTLTHPATWGPARRLVLEDAAAGFGTVRMLPEPVAAATYFTQKTGAEVAVGSAVVVFDFGGGTFDASVVRRTTAGFEVLSVDGAEDLGGVDVDYRLLAHIGGPFGDTPEWTRLTSPTTPEDRRVHRTLVDDIRSAKELLSRHTRADLLVPLLNRETHLTRDELDEVTGPLLARATRITAAVIRASRLAQDEVAGVFLVGGASRMPLVATLLHREIGIPPTVLDHPELVVAHGATLEPVRPATVGTQFAGAAAASGVTQAQSGLRAPVKPSILPRRAVPHRSAAPAKAPPLPLSANARPPKALQVARIVGWAQVFTIVVGLVSDEPRYPYLQLWLAVVLVLSIAGAVTLIVKRRERWQEWIALGAQFGVVGSTYLLAGEGLPTADSTMLLMSVVLLTGAVAVPLLFAAAGWFAGVPVATSAWWLTLTRVLAAAQFVLLAYTVLVGFELARIASNSTALIVVHIGVAVGAAVVSRALNVPRPRLLWWWVALITQYVMVAVGLAAGFGSGWDDHGSGIVAYCALLAATIPLTHAARRFYTAS